MTQLSATLISGLIAGGTAAVIAVGLTVTFGIMDIVNFAHGGFVVLGGFVAFAATRDGVPLWASVLLALVSLGVVGAILERGLFRYTLRNPFNGLVISVGLLALMQEGVSRLFGSNSQPVRPFTYAAVDILGTRFGWEQLLVGGVGFAAVVTYWTWIRYSRFGLYTRAVAQDREVAGLLGVQYGRIFTLNFAMGAGLAGLAGALVATVQPVSAFSADGPTLTAFTVVIIGTLGSIPGVIVAGIILGVAQDLGVSYVSANFANLYPFILVLVILAIKPAGLFGSSTLKVRAG